MGFSGVSEYVISFLIFSRMLVAMERQSRIIVREIVDRDSG
jgi:hypothetical protein